MPILRKVIALPDCKNIVVAVMAGDPDLFVNHELTKEIQSIAQHYPRKNLPAVIDKIAHARAQILLGNMNIDATLTDLFLKVHRSR